jgi:nucleoid-associated protein YgaU
MDVRRELFSYKFAGQHGKDGIRAHTIKRGDTLSAIAREYGTTVDKLCRLNGISKTVILRPGQRIKVP